MRASSFVLIFVGLLVSFAKGQAPVSDDTTETQQTNEAEMGSDGEISGGEAASTDVSKYAGTYKFTYYYNNTGGFGESAQLPCTTSESFTVTIPDDPSNNIINKDVSNVTTGHDPIYNTKEGQWQIAQLTKANGFDILKMRLYLNDNQAIYACWGLNLVDKRLTINVNPSNLTYCPTTFAPISTICTPNRATILGECLSGVCNGEKSKFATADPSSNAYQSSPVYFISLILISLSLL